ncbi:hypothetical protein LY90DRAFT_675039 [Neocallimastix californiae]|uniref:Coth-domain-containing protein n=1 Tax=Neocallimastix californiae TaxID=1754190 RepID=A0A1Y2AQV4_9FUNG|nr:hypothetical protein LY90DRAFT_675039 [Neocallimastix californiae]|eukprot:ORY24931.1 hypothetical protein LY90DRAFT_675039 [Neocallimastix californiae]
MNNFKLFLLIGLAYIINVQATVKFKVLCGAADYGGTGVTVYIDGVPNPMQSLNQDILWEFSYEGTPTEYYYEVTGTAQNELKLFGHPRTWDPQSTTTLYEVFGRRHTIGDDIIKTIPRIYEPLPGYDKYSALFQEGEIPVINVQISAADYRQGSKTQEKKPYKIELSENEQEPYNAEVYDRKEFKLRNVRFDESGIKNKIVGDMAESLGLPISQSAPCRLYINNVSYGLYEIADMYKKKFVRRFFNTEQDADGYVYGSLYKGVSGEYPAYLYSDFGTSKIQSLYESIVEPSAGGDPHQDIQNMIAWLEALPDNAPKSQIEAQFDIDMFLKYAALEYLICHWDGYLSNGNNFFIYIEPNNGKYHFFSYDFDLTMGKWCEKKDGTIDDYVKLITGNKGYGKEPKRLPLMYKKIIMNPEINPQFVSLIQEIVGNLFNIEALGPRIDYFYEFLKDDLYWDIFSYNFIKTQFFKGADVQPVPTQADVDAQYTDLTNPENLKAYVKYKSENVASVYNINGFKNEGKYGEVGGKLITIGKSTE